MGANPSCAPFLVGPPLSSQRLPGNVCVLDGPPMISQRGGGRSLSRLGRFQLLEGEFIGDKMAVIQFDTKEHAVACYKSPEYQKAKKLWEGKTEGLFFVLEGTGS